MSQRPARHRIPCLLVVLFGGIASPSLALNPSQQISQYGHTAWRMLDGVFPGPPHAITQTADGYLWIGTESGLVRFDGARFVPWSPPPGSRAAGAVISLLGARDGSLWIGSQGGLARSKADVYQDWRLGRVNAILEDRTGKIWVGRSRIPTSDSDGPLCGGGVAGFQCFGTANGADLRRQGVEALLDDQAGGVWAGAVKGIYHWTPRGANVYQPKSLAAAEGTAGVLALGSEKDGALLVGIGAGGPSGGLQRFTVGSWSEFTVGSLRGSQSAVSAMLRDRDGGLWIGTPDSGLLHIRDGSVDTFNEADGLSANSIESLFEDREGNVWAVSSRGLDRFRELPVVSIGRRQGLSTEHVSTVSASGDAIWVGNRTFVDVIRDGRIASLSHPKLPGKATTSILQDHSGRLWLGMDAGLNVETDGAFQPIRTPDGKTLGVVFGLVEGADRHVYAIVTGRPQRVYDIVDRKVIASVDLPKSVASRAFAAARQGGVWLVTGGDTLMHYQSGKLETIQQLRPSPRAGALIEDEQNELWIAGFAGLGRWAANRWQLLTTRNGLACDYLHSLIFDARGDLWLAADCGVMSIAHEELQRSASQADPKIPVRTFDAMDGVQAGESPFQPTVSKSPDGRLWFASDSVLQVIDPVRPSGNPLPPPVLIENVVADGAEYRPRSALRLPARIRSLRIEYTALSMTAPQKVRFRYALEGSRQGWQDAGIRRQAFYNDLPPGSYRFHVIACNDSGVWNQSGASLEFSVLPAYYQTIWFRSACALAGVLALWTVYRIRLNRITAVMTARFDERVAERNRLAGEFHDTVLQTVQATRLVADNARANHSTDPVRLREALDDVSQWLLHATNEMRAALNALRESTSQRNDLAEALQRAVEASHVTETMRFVLAVDGPPRHLHPIVRDEVYRISCEAIRNAVRHSAGTELHAGIAYGTDLVLRIADNGRGMAPDLLAQGAPGHFGIPGMRERAERIHGTLRLRSGINQGTEVELRVPGAIVYNESAGRPRSGPDAFRRILGRWRR